MSQRDTVVFDLDGTLSDCSARRHLVEGKDRDYEAFHARFVKDKKNVVSHKKVTNDTGNSLFDTAIITERNRVLRLVQEWNYVDGNKYPMEVPEFLEKIRTGDL